MASIEVDGKVTVVVGVSEAEFKSLDTLLGSNGTVMLTHFVGGVGLVLFQEASEAADALGSLKGEQVDNHTVDTRLPTDVEKALMAQMVRTKKMEELMTLLGLSGTLPSGANGPGTTPSVTPPSASSGSAVVNPQMPSSTTTPVGQQPPAPQQTATPPTSHYIPKLPYFSGVPDRKDDVSFDLWAGGDIPSGCPRTGREVPPWLCKPCTPAPGTGGLGE